MSASGILNRLKGDVLLAGSHILTQIETLKSGLQYGTDGKYVSFDDHFLFLQENIDKIKRISLADAVPTLQANQYENELLSALEEVLESAQKWETRAIAFQGRLQRAVADINELAAGFESWYYLAAVEVLEQQQIKFPTTNIKALATAEFNRLMDRSNLTISALVEAVKIEIKRLDSKRKMARQKFEMGCKQVDAAWATRLPESKGFGGAAPAFDVLKSGVIEEDFDDADEPAAYVSHKGGEKKDLNAEPVPLKTVCSICYEPQFDTPSGTMCKNNHGGVDGIDPSEVPANKVAEPVQDGDKHEQTVAPIQPGALERVDYTRPAAPELTEKEFEEAKGAVAHMMFGPGEVAISDVALGTVKEIRPNGEVVVELAPDAPAATEEAVIEAEVHQPEEEVTGDYQIEVRPEPTAEAAPARTEEAPKPAEKPVSAAKRFDFDDFDDEPTPPVMKPVENAEIKGTFRKEVVSGPVQVIGVTVGDNEVTSHTPKTQESKPAPETASIEARPTERKQFDFDDFDIEDSGTTAAPASVPVVEEEIKPTPAPVTAAKTPAATPRKATPVFDFDDDELS